MLALLQVKSASIQAGVSTASMGKFDKRLPNEKEGERHLGTKRRQFMPVADSKGTERTSAAALADSIVRARADDVLDVGHAIGKIETERREKKQKQRAEGSDKTDSMHLGHKSGRGGASKPSRGNGFSRGGGSSRGGGASSRGGRFDKGGRGAGRGGSSSRGSRGGSSAKRGRGGPRGRR